MRARALARRYLPEAVQRWLRRRRAPAATGVPDYLRALDRILEQAPNGAVSPHALFADVDDAFWFWLNTDGMRQRPEIAAWLPILPPEDQQARFTGLTGDATLRQAFEFYHLVVEVAGLRLGEPRAWRSVLEFGCGWGRILRFFLKALPPEHLWGVDCVAEVIGLCQRTNHRGQFQLIRPLPPTQFPDKTFDVVYAYSVFSHLSEDAHARWVREFVRLLRPGGVLVVTTRPREFIPWCAQVRRLGELPPWSGSTAMAFPETEHWLRVYDAGEYCHTPTGGGGELEASFFGETCIPRAYVERHWPSDLKLIDYITDRRRCEQNVIVAQRGPGTGRAQ